MTEVIPWLGFTAGVVIAIAAPGPWSGDRRGFPGVADAPNAPSGWVLG